MQGPEYDGFTWDEEKSERCQRERGFGFEDAVKIFENGFIEAEDRRRDYGEQRFVTIGQVDDIVITVVWTPRENRRRIISARPASRAERNRLYGERETYQQADP